MESKHLSVYRSDIEKIGHTTYNDDTANDKTSFICDIKTANIEQILLREILNLYGYKILSVDDFGNNVMIITDMPWSEYTELEF